MDFWEKWGLGQKSPEQTQQKPYDQEPITVTQNSLESLINQVYALKENPDNKKKLLAGKSDGEREKIEKRVQGSYDFLLVLRHMVVAAVDSSYRYEIPADHPRKQDLEKLQRLLKQRASQEKQQIVRAMNADEKAADRAKFASDVMPILQSFGVSDSVKSIASVASDILATLDDGSMDTVRTIKQDMFQPPKQEGSLLFLRDFIKSKIDQYEQRNDYRVEDFKTINEQLGAILSLVEGLNRAEGSPLPKGHEEAYLSAKTKAFDRILQMLPQLPQRYGIRSYFDDALLLVQKDKRMDVLQQIVKPAPETT